MTLWLFVALVLVMALIVVHGLRQAGVQAGVIVAIALAYLLVPGILAWRGMLDRYNPLPAPALLMVLVLTVITLTLTLSSVGGRLIACIGLPALVGFQAFRIPVEWLLHRLYQEGVIPVEMTYAGRNFDIVSGLTAAALGWWLARGGRSPGLVVAWNVLGLALLANIVTIAVLSTPVPFRQFTDGPANLLPSLMPYVWLPTFLVQLALAGHVLIFRHIRSAGAGPVRRSA
jgi:hypothetical protein